MGNAGVVLSSPAILLEQIVGVLLLPFQVHHVCISYDNLH